MIESPGSQLKQHNATLNSSAGQRSISMSRELSCSASAAGSFLLRRCCWSVEQDRRRLEAFLPTACPPARRLGLKKARFTVVCGRPHAGFEGCVVLTTGEPEISGDGAERGGHPESGRSQFFRKWSKNKENVQPQPEWCVLLLGYKVAHRRLRDHRRWGI